MSMIWIAGQTVGTATQLTFSSIPQTFTHLQLRITGRDASATSVNSAFVVFNGSFETHPNHHILSGNGSSVSASAGVTVLMPLPVLPGASAAANIGGSIIVDILDYSNTNKNKTVRAIGGVDLNGSGTVSMHTGFRINTEAVTSLTLGGAFTTPYLFATGTRVDLYGLTASSVPGVTG